MDSTTGLQMAYLKQWAERSDRPLTLRVPARSPARAGRCGATPWPCPARRRSARRPGLPRPAVQPAPLRRQLPRVGDPGGLGRPRALRRGVQTGRPPGARRPQRLQQPPHDARGPGLRGAHDRGRRGGAVVQRRVMAQPASSSTSAARSGATSRCWPSTRPATWGPGSASTVPKGRRSARCRTCATPSTSWCAARRPGSGPWSRRGRGIGPGPPGRPPGAGAGRLTPVAVPPPA